MNDNLAAATRPATIAPIPDSSAPWARRFDLPAYMIEDGIRISAADYDYAAHCINCHDQMLAALKECEEYVDQADFRGCEGAEKAFLMLRAAITKATGGAA